MFEAIRRSLVKYIDPEAARCRELALANAAAELEKEQQQDEYLKEFAGNLYEVLYNYPYDCFRAILSGEVPLAGNIEDRRILLSTAWAPKFNTNPPQATLERAVISIFDLEIDPLQRHKPTQELPTPFFELRLHRVWGWNQGWELEERDYRQTEWPHGQDRIIEKNPLRVREWIECAKAWHI